MIWELIGSEVYLIPLLSWVVINKKIQYHFNVLSLIIWGLLKVVLSMLKSVRMFIINVV